MHSVKTTIVKLKRGQMKEDDDQINFERQYLYARLQSMVWNHMLKYQCDDFSRQILGSADTTTMGCAETAPATG